MLIAVSKFWVSDVRVVDSHQAPSKATGANGRAPVVKVRRNKPLASEDLAKLSMPPWVLSVREYNCQVQKQERARDIGDGIAARMVSREPWYGWPDQITICPQMSDWQVCRGSNSALSVVRLVPLTASSILAASRKVINARYVRRCSCCPGWVGWSAVSWFAGNGISWARLHTSQLVMGDVPGTKHFCGRRPGGDSCG